MTMPRRQALAWVGGLAGLPAWAGAVPTRLASVFGPGMVLQREQPLWLWGSGAPGRQVQVRLAGRQAQARVGASGRWQLRLPALPAGGPHVLELQAEGMQRLEDVWIGDVWLCAGQSNMEWTLAQAEEGAQAVAQAASPRIRHRKVAHHAHTQPQSEVQAELPAELQAATGPAWQAAVPAQAGGFSAVGYHFARQVQARLGVPIGLLNVSWGGTRLETWLSRRAAAALPEVAPQMPAEGHTPAHWLQQRQDAARAQAERWQGAALPSGEGANVWADPAFDDAHWPLLQAPGVWEGQGLPGFDGVVWMRRSFELSAQQAAGEAELSLGAIDDCDDTYLNGQRIGGLCTWDAPRRYAVPAGLLRPGRNLLAVRITDTGGDGGFHGQPQAMHLATTAGRIELAGAWRAQVASVHPAQALAANDAPTLAFNGMVAPLAGLRLRGVLWYQGESNVGQAASYAGAFPALIEDWRRHFGMPRLPFLFVQLAGYDPAGRSPYPDSAWAELREAQAAARRLPATGMAVAADVGDARDIHPRDKRSVGLRLAALALRQVHGQAVPAQGPRLQAWRARAGQAWLRFAAADGGLQVRGGGALAGFWVADATRRFVPAVARLLPAAQVHLSHPQGLDIAAVRYAWADDPAAANLQSGAGLPAEPFRTDRWPRLAPARP